MEMPQSFPDWYRTADIQIDSESVAKRWSAVAGILDGMTIPMAVSLAKFLIRSEDLPNELNEELITAFQTTDPSFGPLGNANELRVLAGCILCSVFEGRAGEPADAASLATRCLTFQFSKTHNLPVPATLELARRHIEYRSIELRKRTDLTLSELPELDLSEQVEEVDGVEEDVDGQIQASFRIAIETLEDRFQDLVNVMHEFTRHHAKFLAAQDEELNIVWWLFGGSSREENVRFEHLPTASVCIRAAKELADLTSFNIGPSGVRAYLDYLIRASSDGQEPAQIDIESAIGTVETSWRAKWVGDMSQGRLNIVARFKQALPITFALVSCENDSEANSWVGLFDALGCVGSSDPLDTGVVALQFYDELLLTKLLNGKGSE